MVDYVKDVTVNNIDFKVVVQLQDGIDKSTGQATVLVYSSDVAYGIESIAVNELDDYINTTLNERLEGIATAITKPRKTLIEAGFTIATSQDKPKEILNG